MRTGAVESFATSMVAPRQRLAFWNAVAAETFGAMSVEGACAPFAGQLRRRRVGSLLMADVASSPARVHGLKGGACEGGYFILLNESGCSRMAQGGREVFLRPGELTVLRAEERFDIEFPAPNRCLVLFLPGTTHAADLESHAVRCHPSGEAPLLAGLLRQLALRDPGGGTAVEQAARLAAVTRDVLALTWPARRDAAARRSMADWWEAIRGLVERRFADPDFDVGAVAQELGVSRRFVHMVFAHAGERAERYIVGRRLEAAAGRLSGSPPARVTDVAFEVGFSDLSHFCRVFRRRFGRTPRGFRLRAVEPGSGRVPES